MRKSIFFEEYSGKETLSELKKKFFNWLVAHVFKKGRSVEWYEVFFQTYGNGFQISYLESSIRDCPVRTCTDPARSGVGILKRNNFVCPSLCNPYNAPYFSPSKSMFTSQVLCIFGPWTMVYLRSGVGCFSGDL